MTPGPLVPADFAVPSGLQTELFVLEPLGPEHNEADHAAWMASIEHIRLTPGFAGRKWPIPMSLEQNAGDLVQHARDFGDRSGFTYTVLEPASGDVIGCVYIYPARRERYDVDVRSWVRADRAELDKPLYEAISQWLADSWPFARPDYAPR
jgi:hypothetical protein